MQFKNAGYDVRRFFMGMAAENYWSEDGMSCEMPPKFWQASL